MAGHSHSANIKHKKERNDSNRSKLFLKVRRQLELLIQNEGLNEKVFCLARKNKFPKEKVEKIAQDLLSKKENRGIIEKTNFFFKGLHDSLLYFSLHSEKSNEIKISDLVEIKEKLKKEFLMDEIYNPLTEFKLFHFLEIKGLDKKETEKIILELPTEFLEFSEIEQQQEKKNNIIFSDENKETIERIKEKFLFSETIQTIWSPLKEINLEKTSAKDYFKSLISFLKKKKLTFYVNEKTRKKVS